MNNVPFLCDTFDGAPHRVSIALTGQFWSNRSSKIVFWRKWASRFTNASVRTLADPHSDGVPAVCPRPRRRLLVRDDAIQQGRGGVGVGALQEDAGVMAE